MICKSPSSVTTTGLLTDFDFTIRPSHHHLQTIHRGVTPIGIMRESESSHCHDTHWLSEAQLGHKVAFHSCR